MVSWYVQLCTEYVQLCTEYTMYLCTIGAQVGEDKGKKRKEPSTQDVSDYSSSPKQLKVSGNQDEGKQVRDFVFDENGAAVHAGGLSQECCDALDLLNNPSSANPRNPADFSVDPFTCNQPVKVRNPDLATIFAHQSEFEAWRHCTWFRCSQFQSDSMFQMITKVRFQN